MSQLILLIHVFAAVCIVGLVLIQQGKGAVMGAAFGSGASQTVFGSRGSGSFLFRLTMGLMILFFATSILLNYLTAHNYRETPVLPVIPSKTASVANPSNMVPPPVITAPQSTIPVRRS